MILLDLISIIYHKKNIRIWQVHRTIINIFAGLTFD